MPALRVALLRLVQMKQAAAGATRALRALAGFAKLKVKYTNPGVALDFKPEPGLADSGGLDADLADLTIGEAARERGSAIVLVIVDLHYVPEEQLITQHSMA